MFAMLTDEGLVALPALGTVSSVALQDAMKAPEAERVWVLIEALATRETLAVLDLLPTPVFRDVVSRWEADAGVTVGDLFRIATLIKHHAEALEADLIGEGMRLRHFPSDEFTWRDLKVIIKHLSVHSQLYAAVYPDRAGWDIQNYLLADIADGIHWLQWAKTKDGRKGRNRPQPIPRPGIVPPPRDGSKPKPSTLSAIKEKFAARYQQASRTPKSQKLNALFGRR
jgi:hypothetical protein